MAKGLCASALNLLRCKIVRWWRFNITHRYCKRCRHWLRTNTLAGRCFKNYGQQGQLQTIKNINGTKTVKIETPTSVVWTVYCAMCDDFEEITE